MMTAEADKEVGTDTTMKDLSENDSKVSENDSKVISPDTNEQNPPKGSPYPPKYSHPQKDSFPQTYEQEAPSRHLWVGNVSTSVTEAELAEQFSRFGDIESVTAYPSRNYAFVNFKTVEDGSYAKKGLQGTVLGGLAIRIEFAKGAKPSKHIWIGNVSNSVTKEQLEEECKKYGVVDDVRILRDRNCAFVDFSKTDEAIAAFENLNKKLLGTDELCVEYVKSQLQLKKDSQPRSDERATSQDQGPAEGFGGKTTAEKPKRDRDEPSEILWIGFPLCMKIDERKLHRAFSPFGGIERITTFSGRTYAFVQFHSVKAATRAKNVLQGKLFNDPRVSISFAKSEIGPVDHHTQGTGPLISHSNANMPPLLFTKPASFSNPRNDRFFGPSPFRPHSPSFRRRPEGDVDEANLFFQSSRHEAGFRGDMDRVMRPGLDTWGSPALPEGAFMHSRHAPHVQERWVFQEEGLGRREPKRPRVAGNHSGRGEVDELSPSHSRDDRDAFQVVKAHDYVSKVPRMSNSDTGSMDIWEDHSQESSKRPLEAGRHSPGSKVDPFRPAKDNWIFPGMPVGHAKDAFQWQGVIAKSGTSVCRARCYPIGKVANVVFPGVVNCTARTSLDMLAKHISEVGEFSLVSFVPHGDIDAELYQDFVIYLSEKNRAAVCKLSPESTLFLVPPSDFVEHFLKVPRDNNIIGVLLKLQQPLPSSTEQMGMSQLVQAGGLLSAGGLPSDNYQQSMSQASSEHKMPGGVSIQAPFHAMPMPLTEAMTSHTLLPPHSSQSSGLAGSVYPSTGGISGNLVRPSNPLGHGSVIDDNRAAHMSLPPGYAFMQQTQSPQQHSTPFGLASTRDLNPHQEQGMQISSQLPILASTHDSSTPGQYPLNPIHNTQMKNANYHQQPPLPQYPHPSTQQKQPSQPPQSPLHNVPSTHSDQIPSHVSSIASTHLQPFRENTQPIVQPQGAVVSQHPHQNMAPAPTEQWSTTGSQVFQPPPVAHEEENRGFVDSEQRDLLQLAQQKLSEATGESGQDNKRFQATLELAAALLQQLQQRAKP